MKSCGVIFFLLWGLGALGQSSGLGVGAAAPPVGLEYTWFAPAEGLPPGADALAAAAGKPVVLEFWTTWCAPCIAAMPHLSRLASEFGDRVQFISISNEDTATINRFLRKRRPAGWVGTDTDNSVLGPYGITSFPTTVVLNADHSIAGVTHPDKLTPSSIRALIEGRWKAPEQTPSAATGAAMTEATLGLGLTLEYFKALRKQAAATHVYLVPASQGIEAVKATNLEQGVLIATVVTVGEAYALAFDVDESRVMVPEALRATRWAIAAKVGSEQRLRELLHLALDSALAVRATPAQELVTTYGAKRLPELQASSLFPAAAPSGEDADAESLSRVGNENGLLVGQRAPFSSLVEQLTAELGSVVFDETGLTGLWDWDLSWDASLGTVALLAAVRSQLGIELVPSESQQTVVRLLPK